MCRNSFKRPSELNFVVWSLSSGSIRHLDVTMAAGVGRNREVSEARTSSICKALLHRSINLECRSAIDKCVPERMAARSFGSQPIEREIEDQFFP